MSTPEKTWWYAANNQKYGPYTEDELRALAQSGQFAAHDLVWQLCTADLVRASAVDGLVFAASAPDVPPAMPAAAGPADAGFLAVSENDDGVSAPPQQAPDAEPPHPLAVFVASNYAYYARKWADSERRGHVLSWNWAAFFLGLFWMAYRKMYVYCAVFIGVVATFTGTIFALQLPQEQMQEVLQVAQIVFALFFGLFGNHLYKMHAQQKLRKIAAQHPPHTTQQQLAQQGGASLVGVIGVATGMVLTMAATGMVLSLLLGKHP